MLSTFLCWKVTFCVDKHPFSKMKIFKSSNNFKPFGQFLIFDKLNNKLLLSDSQILKINVSFFY
jgi:hypothetical protein